MNFQIKTNKKVGKADWITVFHEDVVLTLSYPIP